jgi:hypothetical protein
VSLKSIVTTDNQFQRSSQSSDWIDGGNGYWATLAGFDVFDSYGPSVFHCCVHGEQERESVLSTNIKGGCGYVRGIG